jgi:hypothetical protein
MAVREEQMFDRDPRLAGRGDVRREPEEVRRSVPARASNTAMVSRTVFTQHRTNTQRALAISLFVGSVSGAAIWGGGGIAAWVALTPNLVGLGFALALQVALSWAQLIYSDRPKSVPYIGSLLISSSMTLAGYIPLVLVGLASASIPAWSFWGVVALVATVVACALADIVPERTLLGK